MLELAITVIVITALSGALAVAIRIKFPKRGDWLPVLVTTFVPPAIFAIYSAISFFNFLVELGKVAEKNGPQPAGSIDFVIGTISALAFYTVTWMIFACPAAFVALRLVRRK